VGLCGVHELPDNVKGMSKRLFDALMVLFLIVPASCSSPQPTPEPAGNATATAPAGIDKAGMDTSVAAGDDFNAYVNGQWLKTTEIPPDKSSYGPGNILSDATRKQTVELIQGAAGTNGGGAADARKIGDFYSSYMDEAAIEAKGIAPLRPKLDAISAISDKPALTRVLGANLRADVDPLNATNFQTENLMGVFVSQALMDPEHNTPYLLQGGLGMPERDYYLSNSPHMAELRKQYQAHIAAMLKIAGLPDPEGSAARIFALESKIANAHATRTESADVQLAQAWNRADLPKKAPGMDWTAFLDAAGLNEPATFIVWHPKAIAGLAALVGKEPVASWKDWLTYHTIEQAANFLPKAFVDERFAFFGKALFGIPEQRPRWQRGVDFTSGALGEVVGKLYVEKHFPPESKAKVRAMVDDIVKAFNKRIDSLDWMSPETKTKAKEKVATLRVGVGYPDKWQDYSSLEVVKGDALGNADRAVLFEYRRQLAKLKQPVDKGEWWMSPQTVNAVNLPLQNALNFPAAILQPPYFNPAADNAYNYGSIGAIIGHEISHSFDDMGSQFDAQGRLANWWTKQDLDHFRAAGEALVRQYDSYRPFADLAVNGRQTLSENIADLAGLAASYDAYHLSLQGKPADDQQFFISFGQSWRSKDRDEALRQQIATDGHAPDQYRLATVRNLDAWYPAFNVQPGQKLYLDPKDRVRVW
jgi:putative endopeptidase